MSTNDKSTSIGEAVPEIAVQRSSVSGFNDLEAETERINSDQGQNMGDRKIDEHKEQNQPGEDDYGWDETAPLSGSVQGAGAGGSDRDVAANSKLHSDNCDQHDDAKCSLDNESRGEVQTKRPNIWKELEKMQMHSSGGRDNRAAVAPRFQKSADYHRGQADRSSRGHRYNRGRGSRNNGSRPENRRSWTEEFNSPHFGRQSTRMHEDSPFSKGSEARYAPETRISKETPAFRSVQATLRGGGRAQEKNFRNSPRTTARHSETTSSWKTTNKTYLDRQVYEDESEPFDARFESNPAPLYSGLKSRRSHDRDNCSDEDDVRRPEPIGRNSRFPADDVEMEQDYNQRRSSHQSDASLDDPTFEPFRQTLENLDHSSRSTKAALAMVVKLADDYCDRDPERWLKLIDQIVMAYAVDQGALHVEFATSIFSRFIDRPVFQKAAYASVMRHLSEIMAPRDWTEQDHLEATNLCDLFGRLLVQTWPAGWDSCAKECNMIVYAIMNAVQTWLQTLEKSSTRIGAVRKDLVEVSAMCICHLATISGRKLWLKWPDLVDQMYGTLRHVIVSRSCSLDEDMKLDLLDLYVKLNDWPKPAGKQTSTNRTVQREAGAQTEHRVENFASTVPARDPRWSGRSSAFEAVSPAFIGRQERAQRSADVAAAQQSMYSGPPSRVPGANAMAPRNVSYGTGLQQQYQQNQNRFAGTRGVQPSTPRLSFIGPLGK